MSDREDRDDDRLAKAMAADRVPAPPAELAGRVVEAMLAGGQAAAPARAAASRLRRAWPVAAALAVGMAIGGPAGLALRPRTSMDLVAGDRRPSAQETIRLGDRAVLVAEAGADLRWRTGPEDSVLVEQRAGDVFYRVNAGRFLVETPFGVVRVTGTCFRVEVSDMKLLDRRNLGVAAVGAALGAAVVVTVYEGRVLLAKGRSEVALGPTERGQLTAAGAPERLAGGEAARGAIAQRSNIPRFDETEALRTRIAEQDKELAQLRPQAPVAAKMAKGKSRILDPSREELLARVERCEVAFDSPPFKGFDERAAQRLGVSEAEREAMNEAMNEVRDHAVAEMRKLYIEMSGDTALADRLSPGTMESEIFAKAPEGARPRARLQLARERAGLASTPADLSQTPVTERTLRLMMSIGHLFERKLAERIGPDRAHSLRAQQDGWGGKTVANGCE